MWNEQTCHMNPLTIKRKKRRRRNEKAPLLLLVLLQCWTMTNAEDAAASSSSSYNSAQNQNTKASQQQEQVTYSKNHGLLNVQKYCRRDEVVVTSAWLTCDSPGAYYYGSKTYRGSEVCIDGDKASLKIYCKPTEKRVSCNTLDLIFLLTILGTPISVLACSQ